MRLHAQNIRNIFFAAALFSAGPAQMCRVFGDEKQDRTAASQPAEKQITKEDARAAMKILLPLEIAFKSAKTDEEKRAVSEKIFAAQEKFTHLFGVGPELHITFEYHGKTYTVPVDCDKMMLRLTKGGFVLVVTPAGLEPIHTQIMLGTDYANSEAEKAYTATASSMYTPIDHKDAQAWLQHVFAPAPGETYHSTHNVDRSVIRQVEEACVKPLQHLNDALVEVLKEDNEKKQAQHSAPQPGQ